MKVRLKHTLFMGGRLHLPGRTVDLEDGEAGRLLREGHAETAGRKPKAKAKSKARKTD